MTADTSLLALARIPGLTAEQLAAAWQRSDEPAALTRLPAAELAASGWSEGAIAALRAIPAADLDADRAWLESSGAHLVACVDAAYPPLLREVSGAPAFLFVRGDPGALATLQIAIVGSRHPTPAGRIDARDFARALSRAGLTITSGLALGIDAAAHRGALEAGGRTIAVCGHGLDVTYPREHAALAAEIAASGAVVSEFPPRTPPLRPHFPQRNRVISGLALGVLVMEAARHSGSLSTANHALKQSRELFAVPGSIHNPLARGCHQLIREGAQLVEAPSEVLGSLQIPFTRQSLEAAPGRASPGRKPAERLDKEYEILLDAVGFEPAGVDALVQRSGLPAESVASMLLILELEGEIAPHAGSRYARVPKQS
jgi:DNA processing protein